MSRTARTPAVAPYGGVFDEDRAELWGSVCVELTTCTRLATATEDDDTIVKDEEKDIVETKVVTLMMALDTVTVCRMVDTETADEGANGLVPTEDIVVRICEVLLDVACDLVGVYTVILPSGEFTDETDSARVGDESGML